MVTKYGEIGTVSHGTMICEDVFDACIYALKGLDADRAKAIQADWDAVEDECESHMLVDNGECDNCVEAREVLLNEDLWNALNEFAPPYGYFGSHPGDGADFGFWIDMEAVEDAVRDGEILKVNSLSDIPSDYAGGEVLQVSDHGNPTLYARDEHGEFQEVWGLV